MKTTIDKAELKKQIIYNVKTLYRKTIDEATPQQVFRQYPMQSRIRSLTTGWKPRKFTKKKTRKWFIICPWSS